MDQDTILSHDPFRAEIPEQLLATQRPAIQIILRNFARIAARILEDGEPANAAGTDIERPHNVFCIDGSRGSGKTYTLLSLDYALERLSAVRQKRALSEEWRAFFEWRDCVGAETLEVLKGSRSRLNSVAHVLRIIFPGDMVAGESLMEMIFAAMTTRLSVEGGTQEGRGGAADDKRKAADDLKKALRDKVERGWYFARRFGLDAIIRDSIDYTDLVQRFDEESQKSSNRIEEWRRFIREYLDHHGAAVLVVLLDDSDVQAELTHDILHSIRMFLNHPRIVTVLAGNIRSMRNSLLHIAMQRIAPSIRALEGRNLRTAVDWRQIERKAVEDYLEKILPPAQRLVLRQPELGRVSGADSDFKKITGRDLSSLCLVRTDAARPTFLSAKFNLAIKRELNESDVPIVSQARNIEEFLSWWVFANRYAAPLAPRSARQIRTFRDLFEEEAGGGAETAKRFRTRKRLTVMLHDVPENFGLIQRLGDQDASLVWWIRQQKTESVWVGQRMFRINDRESFYRHYTYDYIRYRLDVGIAMPFRDNSEELIPVGLLPRVRGRRYMRRFFQPGQMPRQQRRYGAARWIDHAAVPGNCVYFYDLSALPDISLFADELEREIGPLQDGRWEAMLAGRWVELVQDEQDELMLRYFTEIVCERLKGTDKVSSAALVLELNPLDIGRKYTAARYEVFLEHEIRSLSREINQRTWNAALASLEGRPPGQLDAANDGNAGSPEDVENVKRMIALYAALVTDLRRAWHAIRIHEISPGWMESGEAIGSSEEQQRISFAAITSQSHMPLYSRKHLAEKVIFANSPWLRRIVEAFNKEHLLGAIEKLESQCTPEVWASTDVKYEAVERLYTTGLISIVQTQNSGGLTKSSSGESATEEINDYGDWAKTLRHLGRAICSEWPFCDARVAGSQQQIRKKLEDDLFGDSKWQLDVSGQGEVQGEVRKTQRRRNARDARNFVWLVVGLAPSLPAVIHTQLMASIYEAESRRRLMSEDPNADQEIRKAFEGAKQEIKDWAELVGILSVSLRYIKIKCLHIFAKLFIRSMLEDVDRSKEMEKESGKKMEPDEYRKQHPDVRERDQQRVKFLEAVGFAVPEDRADEVAIAAFERLRGIFGPDVSDDLAMMPDVAPSTLFGEQWMIDLVFTSEIRAALAAGGETMAGLSASREPDPPTDNPKSVRGMFGEAEQWLWAANRALRKFNALIEVYGAKGYQFDPIYEDAIDAQR